jgi:hypothetical protein
MATKLSVFAEPLGRRRHHWRPTAYGATVIMLGVLAFVGLVAVVLLVLGLLNVHGVTEHFSIH